MTTTTERLLAGTPMALIYMTNEEIRTGEYVGSCRHFHNQKKGVVDRATYPAHALKFDHIGALSELAAAIVTNRKWLGLRTLGTFDAPDLAGDIEVKGSDYPWGHLILKDPRRAGCHDRIDVPYIKVVQKTLELYDVIGWMHYDEITEGGVEAGRFWATHLKIPAFAVPQENLHPIDALTLQYREEGYTPRSQQITDF